MRITSLAVITIGQLGLLSDGQTEDRMENDTIKTQNLDDVTITSRRLGTRRLRGAENGLIINREELFKAACCNLGESFTTNPSVDVNYSDAATGAKQIKLLGLSGIYVQMLTENLPNFRGASSPYALDYIPGPWMSSIQVSKGASSVRNGYESITGQIDVEYLKPDDEEGVTINLYGNTQSRLEANADANYHFNDQLSTVVLAHYQDDYGHHDVNKDGFLDQPNVRQLNLQNRWKWQGEHYIFHGGLALLDEQRDGGQTHHTAPDNHHLFKIGIENDRYEGFMKHAFILEHEHGTNIALMSSVSMHRTDAGYGHKHYNLNEKNAYAQLLFETHFTEQHNLSAGFSLNYDYLKQSLANVGFEAQNERETISGVYAQYTYSLDTRLTVMAGIRADYSSIHGTFVTPRFHLKYAPTEAMSLRLSLGKGYRSAHALAENSYLLVSGRKLVIDDLKQESALNYGISSSFNVPLFGKILKLNAEYYHTHFSQQLVIDYDSNPTQIHITNLDGRSYSNTIQVDATYPIVSGLELTAAWRWNDVKTTYGGILREKPLTSRYKGLVTTSYKTPLGLWQFDVTLQINGGGRMPAPTIHDDGTSSWDSHFHSYEQLSAMVTRWFRYFSVYVGGENLTGFRQKQTIISANDPWSESFDPTMVWGPVHGAMAFVGIRINFGRL